MFNLGLSKRQTEALWDALTSSHRIKIIVRLHDEDEERVNDFDFRFGSTHLISGAVQVDTTQDVTRSLSMTLLDPFRRFRWTPDRTSPGTLYAGDFVSVRYGVEVEHDILPVSPATILSPHQPLGMFVGSHLTSPETEGDIRLEDGDALLLEASGNLLTEAPPVGAPTLRVKRRKPRTLYEIPVFWGPLTAYEANGPEITIEAQGKESLAMSPHFAAEGYTLKKNMHTDDAIKEVMQRIGERRFSIPNLPYRIGKDRNIHPRSEPWKIINGGEQVVGGGKTPGLIHRTGKHPHHAFYDGEGNLKVRRLNHEPVVNFDDSWLLSPPDVTFDDTTFINHVVVLGAKPAGKGKKPVKGEASLPKHFKLSPWALARNGNPRYLTLYITADNLKTERDCRQRAHHLLNHHSRVGLDVSFDCLPLPMLEELDYIHVKTREGFTLKTPLKQFTIPLTSDQSMSIGQNKPIRTKPKRVTGAAGPGGPGGRGGNTPGGFGSGGGSDGSGGKPGNTGSQN